MLLYLTGKLLMFKNWLIAGGVFIAGLAAAVLFARSKQKSEDSTAVKEAVNDALSTIAETSKEVKHSVDDLPATGPGSPGEQLRDDWSER